MIDRNLQPYDADGDTKGGRNLAFISAHIMPHIESHCALGYNALDLGAGNGRFCSLIRHSFGSIVCVEPVDTQHDNFKYPNVTWLKKTLETYVGENPTFVNIFLIGSFLALEREYGDKLFPMLERLLFPSGKIFIMVDANQGHSFESDILVSSQILVEKDTLLVIMERKCQY